MKDLEELQRILNECYDYLKSQDVGEVGENLKDRICDADKIVKKLSINCS